MRVLVVNAGSSSLKLRLVDADDRVAGRADLPAVGRASPDDIAAALADLGPCDAVGHRVVHGGERFREPVVVDAAVRRALDELTVLAPLHQPKSLAALDAVTAAAPDVPSVACFDTAFHATLRPEAATYAVPAEWRERYGVRRYGFHGLSHAYAARRAAEVVGAGGGPTRRIVTCHLGAGASLAAVHEGLSVDTTMGFTPLEGLTMATRSGTVDPGAVLWLVTRQGSTPPKWPRRSSTGPACSAWPARPTWPRSCGAPTAATRWPGWRSPSTSTGCGRGSVRWPPASAGSTCWCTPAAWARTPPPCGPRRPARSRSSASPSTPPPTPRWTSARVIHRGVCDIGAPGAAARVLVVAAREDLEIARGVRALLT